MDQILQKLPSENESQYIWKVGQAKDSGLIDNTWEELTPILNAQCGINEEDYRGSSAWRKRYRVMQQAWDDVFSQLQFADEHAVTIKEQIDELYKAKRQLFDQRREYNKIRVSDARADNLAEKLIDAANIVPLKHYSEIFTFKNIISNKEAVLLLSDWHYGQVSNNVWNSIGASSVSLLIGRTKIKQLSSFANIWALKSLIVCEMSYGVLKLNLSDFCSPSTYVAKFLKSFQLS